MVHWFKLQRVDNFRTFHLLLALAVHDQLIAAL